jgi:immune inhibitor A
MTPPAPIRAPAPAVHVAGSGHAKRGGSRIAQSLFFGPGVAIAPMGIECPTSVEASVRKLITILSSVALLFSLTAGAVSAHPSEGKEARKEAAQASKGDNRLSKLGRQQQRLKQRAQELVLQGKVQPVGDNQVVKVAKGQYVELAFEGEDQILTLLGEFGEEAEPFHGGRRTSALHADHGGDPGPLHNDIPEPDRNVDNTTIWEPDFSQSYYDALLYDEGRNPSMANWYLEQSSGRYSVDGHVSDWVQVPFNAANYGSNYCGDIVCQDTWFFVQDQANVWWDELVAEKGSVAAANAFLATFDVWDRYNYDGDTNFNEPDGYIDHFQSVHAGEGEETGGGAQGEDAIWSHRWYVQLTAIGAGGPSVGGTVVPFGGTQIGASNYWIGDYTIEPENGGVGVFAHEFGHDLGLPDLYDTSGNTGGAENSTAWWTIMSQGSYGSVNGIDIGSAPTHFGNWEKFQLGWLNYDVAVAGAKSSHKLGPAETNTRQAQGLFVVLPDKIVPLDLGDPFEGSQYYYSEAGDNLDNSMTKSVTLPATGDLELNAQVRYDIETDWDYAYLTVNGVGVDTNLSTDTNPNGQNFGNGITGSSSDWDALTADLSAFAGQTVTIGFRYWTDGAVVEPGFQVDALEIPGQPFDGAEAAAGWTFDGFRTTSGSETQAFFNAYVAEFRQYRGYDRALKLGPYNFIDPANEDGLGNYVEHFPYQDGLLISYWDTSFSDNNVGDHPGGGLLLPIDAHPSISTWSDGSVARPRIQSYDSTFGLWATDPISLHSGDLTLNVSSKRAVPLFDDSRSYWVNGHPGDAAANGRYQSEWASVNVPNTGTTIRVVTVSAQGSFMQVNVNN